VEGCNAGEVLLIPQDPALRRDGFIRRTLCDANGRYAIGALRPGEYYGIARAGQAVGGGSSQEVDDRLLRQSARVTVRANETTSVDLRLMAR
jgi:hypothetical protein